MPTQDARRPLCRHIDDMGSLIPGCCSQKQIIGRKSKIKDCICMRTKCKVSCRKTRFVVSGAIEQPDAAILVSDCDEGICCEGKLSTCSNRQMASQCSLLQLAVQNGMVLSVDTATLLQTWTSSGLEKKFVVSCCQSFVPPIFGLRVRDLDILPWTPISRLRSLPKSPRYFDEVILPSL